MVSETLLINIHAYWLHEDDHGKHWERAKKNKFHISQSFFFLFLCVCSPRKINQMCLVVLLSYIIFVILLCKIVYFFLCSWRNIKQVCLFMALICFCNSLTCFCHQSRSFSFLHFMCVNMGQNFHGGPNVLPSSFLQIPKLWRTLKWRTPSFVRT